MINGNERKSLHKALLKAFDESEFEAMLDFGFDIRLNDIVEHGDFSQTVLDVIQYFERRGRLNELLEKVKECRPKKVQLHQLIDQLVAGKSSSGGLDGGWEEILQMYEELGKKLEELIREKQLTQPQMYSIKAGVETTAELLSLQNGKNEYGQVYTELYHRLDIIGYKDAPASRFDETMSWLRDWWRELSGKDEPPF